MIVAANYVGDLHECVVNHHHVVVDRHAVGTQNDGIAHDFVGELDVSVNNVVKADGVLGNLQPYGASFARGSTALGFVRVNRPALSRIDRLAAFGYVLVAFFLQILLAAKTQIGFAFVQQALGLFAVEFQAVGLTIGNVGAADVGALVPIESEPFEVGDKLIFEAGFTALDIRILD